MISGINFTGREGMLTAGIKNVKGYGNEVLDRYVNEGTGFSEEAKKQVAKRVNAAKVASEGVQRHNFIPQTELVTMKSENSKVDFFSETTPHHIGLDTLA